MNTSEEIAHSLQVYGKGICWHPLISLDAPAQQRLHELLTAAANALTDFATLHAQLGEARKQIARLQQREEELVGALQDMEERWRRVESLFGNAEYNGVRADTSAAIARAALDSARAKQGEGQPEDASINHKSP